MENNANFREQLKIAYLCDLAKIENVEEFNKIYPSVVDYMKEVIDKSTDLRLLNRVKAVIAFKSKNLGIKL